MCHNSVLAWAGSLPADLFTGKTVLEVGAYDENGSIRPIVEAHGCESYLATDMRQGPGVDLVADVCDLPKQFPDGFDVIVTTSTLEHVEHWRKAFVAIEKLTRVGGHLVFSAPSPGFPYHPYPDDYWRFSVDTMSEILTALGFDAVCLPDLEQPGVFALATKTKRVRKKDPLAGIDVPAVDK